MFGLMSKEQDSVQEISLIVTAKRFESVKEVLSTSSSAYVHYDPWTPKGFILI